MLEVLGIVFIVLVVLALAVVVLVAWKIRRTVRQARTYAAFQQTAHMAMHIHMQPEHTLAWLLEPTPAANRAKLESEGFTEIGCYSVPELAGTTLCALASAAEHIVAILYDTAQGQFVDLNVHYEDDTSLTVSNVPEIGELDRPDEHPLIRKPGADIADLLAMLREQRLDKPAFSYTAENFQSKFEETYHREMVWRYDRGYLSENEIEHIARHSDVKLTRGDVDGIRSMLDSTRTAELYDRCFDVFKVRSPLSISQFERVEARLFVVHEKMDTEDLAETITTYLDPDGDEDEWIAKLDKAHTDPRALFDSCNATRERRLRAQLLDEITEPVSAALYLGPPLVENDDVH